MTKNVIIYNTIYNTRILYVNQRLVSLYLLNKNILGGFFFFLKIKKPRIYSNAVYYIRDILKLYLPTEASINGNQLTVKRYINAMVMVLYVPTIMNVGRA